MTSLTRQRIVAGGLAVAYFVWAYSRAKKAKGAGGIGRVSDVYTYKHCIEEGVLNGSVEKIIIWDNSLENGLTLVSIFDPFIGWYSFNMRAPELRRLLNWASENRTDVEYRSYKVSGVIETDYNGATILSSDGNFKVIISLTDGGNFRAEIWQRTSDFIDSYAEGRFNEWFYLGSAYNTTLERVFKNAAKTVSFHGGYIDPEDFNKL